MKSYKKIEVEEIKTYKCSDGKIFNTKEEAEKHEAEILDPEKAKDLRIKELEERILGLEAEVALLNNRIKALESKKSYPWSQPNPDIYPQPWPPYQQPFNPTTPTPKLPSEPGNVVYDAAELSKLSDEELIKKGYHVYYAGHKRSIIPHVDLSTVCGNATTPPEYIGNPLDNQDCGPNYNKYK